LLAEKTAKRGINWLLVMKNKKSMEEMCIISSLLIDNWNESNYTILYQNIFRSIDENG
jgi:hypothetical protein